MTSAALEPAQIAIIGAGLVGRRTATMLTQTTTAEVVLIGREREPEPLEGVVVAQRWPHPAASAAGVVVLATASAEQPALAAQLAREGRQVITTADGVRDVERLLALDPLAVRHGAVIAVGVAYSPGLSTLLATQLMADFDEVHAIRTAQFGTGGPACARQHHRAAAGLAREVRNGRVVLARGGSGRELVWFPEPVGGADCYRASLAEPLLLHRAFPHVPRIESRQAATRRDRLTARLPMLRPPHAEGLVGAIWTEVRGSIGGRIEHRSLAATAPQATGAAAVVAVTAATLAGHGPDRGAMRLLRPGVRTLTEVDHSVSFLRRLVAPVRLWAYDGTRVERSVGGHVTTQAARKWEIGRELPHPGGRPRPSDPEIR